MPIRTSEDEFDPLKMEPDYVSNGFQQMLDSRSIPKPDNYKDPDSN